MGNASVDRYGAYLRNLVSQIARDAEVGLVAEAHRIAGEMRAKLGGDGPLEQSIEVTELPLVKITAGGELTTKPVEHPKPGGNMEYDYALAEEFGTHKEPAHPFFYSTIRRNKVQFDANVKALGFSNLAGSGTVAVSGLGNLEN